jgi:hypothetical protein
VANYLARVELHKATGEDYETLHEAMRKRGFARFILSSEKKKYRLPTGTYVAEGSTWTLTQAYDFAVTADLPPISVHVRIRQLSAAPSSV